MAGETAVVYEERVYEHEPPEPVATTWLLSLWIGAAATAAAGLIWAILTPTYAPSAVLVYTSSLVFGGPLFVITWLWLDESVVCRHRPFLVLIAFWVAALIVLAATYSADSAPLRLIPAAVPLISCVVLIRIVLSVRARQAAYFESKSPS